MRYLCRTILVFFLMNSLQTAAQEPLSENAFQQSRSSNGTVILQVNWGRYWKCGSYENAQLQRLEFRRLDDNGDHVSAENWVLSPLSTLMPKPSFVPYVVLLQPGQYALSGFKLKVASSVANIKVADVDSSSLIVDGKALGGSFTVAAGEVVYVGHFGVDCHGEPSPWRFYIEEKTEFDRYVSGFHKRYPFTQGVPVTYRLFQTEHFGRPHEVPQ